MGILIKFLLVANAIFIEKTFAQGSCLVTYKNLSIYGNDLNGVSGSASSCCAYCQAKNGCKGWTWDDFNGGTCWLKNDTEPLAKGGRSNNTVTGILSPSASNIYSSKFILDATNFWDQPWFFDNKISLTNVTKNVNKTTAQQLGMIGIQNGKVYMGADHTNSYPNSARLSVQIESTTRFNSGLFILSLDHMPTGPGVWPAFWTINRPYEGEIDVLEGISNLTYNSISLHQWKKDNDTDLCIMKNNDTQFFNGTWGTDWTHEPYLDCYGHARSNSTVMAGCGISAPQRTFNTGFNQAGGGIFALQLNPEKSIKVWNFVQPNIPADIESPNPNPDTWGLPNAYFRLGSNCMGSHFLNQSVIFDIAFCGGWVSSRFPGGEAACENMVQNHPENYTETYWLINYLKIFCRPGEPCVSM